MSDVNLPSNFTVMELTSHDYGVAVNIMLLDDGYGGHILVDTGFPDTWGELHQLIKREMGAGGRIGQIILTHLHPDHCGSSGKAVENLGAELSYHRDEDLIRYYVAELLDNRPSWVPENILEALRKDMAPVLSTPRPSIYVGDGLHFGDGSWELVHTPGHTPGHVCLFNRETATLISGDHLLPEETSNIPYLPVPGYNPLKLYLKSLDRILKLRPRIAVPSHGRPFTNIQDRVAQLFTHHRRRLRETAEAISSNEQTPVSIASHITWSRGRFEELSPIDKWLAILETMAHLEFLVSIGFAWRMDGAQPIYQPGDLTWERVEGALARILDKPSQV